MLMKTNLTINGKTYIYEAEPGESLLNALRRLGFYGVKHGCETGECGSWAAKLDGKMVNT